MRIIASSSSSIKNDNPNRLFKVEPSGLGGTSLTVLREGIPPSTFHQHGGDMLILLPVVRHQIPIKFLGVYWIIYTLIVILSLKYPKSFSKTLLYSLSCGGRWLNIFNQSSTSSSESPGWSVGFFTACSSAPSSIAANSSDGITSA